MATLTYEELTKLPLHYTFGLNHDNYCARRYHNAEWNITKEVFTERRVKGDIYSGFKGPRTWYFMGDSRIYDTGRALWEGEFLTPWFTTEQKPVRSGWYETDQGMLYWFHPDHCWCRAIGTKPLKPTKWRGMRDIKKLTKQQA